MMLTGRKKQRQIATIKAALGERAARHLSPSFETLFQFAVTDADLRNHHFDPLHAE